MADEDDDIILHQPEFKNKFQPAKVKELIRAVLVAHLEDQSYSDDSVPALCSTVCDAVKQKLKASELDRYKFVVQVFIGEQEGAGIRMGSKSYWDDNTDGQASETFDNASLYCVATVFACYRY